MPAPFGRVLTAMITPFDAAGAVDWDGVDAMARHLVDTGSDGIVVAGTTGESPTLSTEEKLGLFRAVVDAVGGRASVVAGTGTYNTAESVELSRKAADIGVDGVMAVTPYYSRPSQAGLIAHFTAIADATELPLMLYNIPGRTATLIEVDTIGELARHDRIVAVKDAVGDTAFTTRTRLAVGADFAIYSGDDIKTFPIMASGGDGVVSVTAHVAGRQVARLVEAAADGDWKTARELHLALARLNRALFMEPSPGPVKRALEDVWGPVGQPRLPMTAASDETLEEIRAALAVAQRA